MMQNYYCCKIAATSVDIGILRFFFQYAHAEETELSSLLLKIIRGSK
jgi:hypothetical protein